MSIELKLGDISIDVTMKAIKNVHLSVHPPTGRVRISAPLGMSEETVRLFAISKLVWIKKQQETLRQQERETPREFLERESHYVWGKRYLLCIEEIEAAPKIRLSHGKMFLSLRPGSGATKRAQIVDRWYRELVKEAASEMILQWMPIIGVKVQKFYVQRMKTRWGSCNADALTIRLNTELAKKPSKCLEYIIVHEMVHILESTHNSRFQVLLTQFMPDWKYRKQLLNQLPVRHEAWEY